MSAKNYERTEQVRAVQVRRLENGKLNVDEVQELVGLRWFVTIEGDYLVIGQLLHPPIILHAGEWAILEVGCTDPRGINKEYFTANYQEVKEFSPPQAPPALAGR